MSALALFGFDLLRPRDLIWLAVAASILLAGWLAVNARLVGIGRLVSARQRKRFLPRFSATRARLRVVLAALALALGAMALAGPVRGYTVREVKRRGLDLVVCIDTSRSMLVRDLRPDRITRARREVRGLLDQLGGDRVALIAFSGEAREVAPLTHDKKTLSVLLEQVSPEDNTRGGTDLGAALERALSMFDGRTGAHEAIVLLTDGEDLEGHGLEIARKAAEKSIRVYVVGMGTEQGGKIPVVLPDGRQDFVRDENGVEVISTMGGKGLAELAQITGGAYLAAGQSPAPLEELYEKRITRLEGRELSSGQENVPHDRFQWFLVLAAGCMLGEFVLRERRPRGEGAKMPTMAAPRELAAKSRRPNADAKVAAVAWLALAQIAPQSAPPTSPHAAANPPPMTQGAPAAAPVAPAKEAPKVAPYPLGARAGLTELQLRANAGKLDEALAIGAQVLAIPALSDKAAGETHYNLAVAQHMQGELAAAHESFEKARALAGPGELRLDAMYDLGAVPLEAAEMQRLQIPEIREKLGMPPLPPPPQVPQSGAPPTAAGAAPDAKPDPLELAVAAYQAAKAPLIDRLRADWRDVDTRANLELIQRRLRELDELKKQREEEKKKQEDQQKQDQDKQDKDKQDQDKKDQDQKDKDQQKQDQDKQDPKDKQDQDAQKPEQQDPKDQKDQKPSDAEKDPKQKPDQKPAEPKPGDERVLTKEEVTRLLEQLQDIEKESQELQQRLRVRRRAPVSKDW